MENTRWIIWSIEHDAWWGPNHRGYSQYIRNAGIYSYTEAIEIINGANYSMTLKEGERFDMYLNTPHEALVLVTPAIQAKIIQTKSSKSDCKKCHGTGWYEYSTTGTPHSKPCERCCTHLGTPFKDPNGGEKYFCAKGCGSEIKVK